MRCQAQVTQYPRNPGAYWLPGFLMPSRSFSLFPTHLLFGLTVVTFSRRRRPARDGGKGDRERG